MLPVDVELTRFRAEIESAQRVQQNLLPAAIPAVAGLDVFAAFRPHSHLSGDFYDFMLDHDGRFTFIVSDVSGKGLPAAMIVSMTHQALRIGASPTLGLSPEDILLKSNAILYEDFSRLASFATVFIGRYDPTSKRLVYASAGHSPVIFKPAGEAARLLLPDGAPVGALRTSGSKNHYKQLKPGDLLVVGTDGLAEAYSDHGDTWAGYRWLLRKIERLANQSARVIAENLFNPPRDSEQSSLVTNYNIQSDDQTVVVIKSI
jgi:phosphoserine phosphatase RsbU/P